MRFRRHLRAALQRRPRPRRSRHFVPHGSRPVPGPPSVAVSPGCRTRSAPASARGTKLALPGLLFSLESVQARESPRTPRPAGRPRRGALPLQPDGVCRFRPLEYPCRQRAQRCVSVTQVDGSHTPLRSAKSPAFSAVSPKSSSAKFPIAARWVSVTFEQSVTAASRFLRVRHQRVAHLRRALAHPAGQRRRRAVDLVSRVRRHRSVAEHCHHGHGPWR